MLQAEFSGKFLTLSWYSPCHKEERRNWQKLKVRQRKEDNCCNDSWTITLANSFHFSVNILSLLLRLSFTVPSQESEQWGWSEGPSLADTAEVQRDGENRLGTKLEIRNQIGFVLSMVFYKSPSTVWTQSLLAYIFHIRVIPQTSLWSCFVFILTLWKPLLIFLHVFLLAWDREWEVRCKEIHHNEIIPSQYGKFSTPNSCWSHPFYPTQNHTTCCIPWE